MGIHRSPVDSPHKGPVTQALMFYFLPYWTLFKSRDSDGSYSCIFVIETTFLLSAEYLPTISYWCVAICLFLFIRERICDTSFSIRDTLEFILVELECVYVCPCCIRTGSHWLIRVGLYHVAGSPCYLSTNLSQTSRMGSNHYKNAVRTCRTNHQFGTNSNHYANKFESFKQ